MNQPFTVKTTTELPKTIEDLHMHIFDIDRLVDPDPIEGSAKLAKSILMNAAWESGKPFAVSFFVNSFQFVEEYNGSELVRKDKPVICLWAEIFMNELRGKPDFSADAPKSRRLSNRDDDHSAQDLFVQYDVMGAVSIIVFLTRTSDDYLEIFASSYGLVQRGISTTE